jgi:two-component system alkaline phosphatase synthesis response regulator PhoP
MTIPEGLSILIVEDEKNLGNTLKEYLIAKGHEVSHAETVESAKQIFLQTTGLDVILMDINLPDGNGIDLAKELRSLSTNFVLLFLSAQNDPETKFQGLELGAEDYITKPFDLRELNLRLSRIFKNRIKLDNLGSEINIGVLKIRFSSFQLVDGNKNEINLSQKECLILELLYTNKNKVISRDEIIQKVWGEDSFPSNRTVDNYIVKLRRWIETDSSSTASITSVRGVGYSFNIKKELK